MKTLKIIFLLTFAFTINVSIAQEKGETGDAKSVKTRGSDPNIVSDEIMNIKGETDPKAIKPGNKGGESRGGDCYTWFNNFTRYKLVGYVDGYRQGTVAPYGDGGVWVGTGNTKMYAVAYFTDGSKTTWGPGMKYCGYGDHMTLEVHEEYYNLFVR